MYNKTILQLQFIKLKLFTASEPCQNFQFQNHPMHSILSLLFLRVTLFLHKLKDSLCFVGNVEEISKLLWYVMIDNAESVC